MKCIDIGQYDTCLRNYLYCYANVNKEKVEKITVCTIQNPLFSMEYAVQVLKVPLVIVLGHDRCGAVKADEVSISPDMEAVVRNITPAVEKTTPLFFQMSLT